MFFANNDIDDNTVEYVKMWKALDSIILDSGMSGLTHHLYIMHVKMRYLSVMLLRFD